MKLMKKVGIIVSLMVLFNLVGCSAPTNTGGEDGAQEDVLEMAFDEVLEQARGTTVTFYGYGGDSLQNAWVDGQLADMMKEKYDITVKRVGMDIDEILNILLNEKQTDVADGNMDVVWINGENFFTAKDNDLLFGPFADHIENFNKYIDEESPDVKYDFGVETEGYEVPYGKAQFVMIYDSAKTTDVPSNHEELLAWAKENPGRFTYPAPPDFTGSAFVRNIISDIVGYEQFLDMAPDYDTVKEAIQPAIDYLVELKPYLWNEGKTYPGEHSLLANMFADGEVYMEMSYNPNTASVKIETGEYPESTRTFVFDRGTIGNTHFVAMPFNSPNKAGAMALINEIISVEGQATKYDPAIWGSLPVLENSMLNEEEKEIMDSVALGDATLPQDVLYEHRIPEMPAALVPIIEEIWMRSVPTEGE